jgi:hypothetical protein
VPLTHELAGPDSAIHRWMQRTLPRIDALQTAWTDALVGARTVRPRHDGPIDWAGIGRAFGYRLGYALACTPPYHALFALPILTGDDQARHHVASTFTTHRDFPVGFCADLRPLPDSSALQLPVPGWIADLRQGPPGARAGLVDFFTTVAGGVHLYQLHHPASPQGEQRFARTCYALGLLEDAYRGGFARARRWLPPTPYGLTADYLHALAPDYLVADLANIADALTRHGLRQLPHGHAIVSPEFIAGWADGDVLIGDLLIDCKTTVKPHNLRPEWIYQILGYALLDVADCYRIRRVGIYLARQARLVTWTLDDLTHQLSGGLAPPFAYLRRDFADVVGSTLQALDAKGWHGRWITNFHHVGGVSPR